LHFQEVGVVTTCAAAVKQNNVGVKRSEIRGWLGWSGCPDRSIFWLAVTGRAQTFRQEKRRHPSSPIPFSPKAPDVTFNFITSSYFVRTGPNRVTIAASSRRRPYLSLKHPVQLLQKPVSPHCKHKACASPLFEVLGRNSVDRPAVDLKHTRSSAIKPRHHTVSPPPYHHLHHAAAASSQHAFST
jgi:hypothetical protein